MHLTVVSVEFVAIFSVFSLAFFSALSCLFFALQEKYRRRERPSIKLMNLVDMLFCIILINFNNSHFLLVWAGSSAIDFLDAELYLSLFI